jgi:methylthioribose-1-phosphate isomerase
MTAKAIEWLDGRLRILDQSKLPREQILADLDNYQDVVLAIKDMKVRGAPAIGHQVLKQQIGMNFSPN